MKEIRYKIGDCVKFCASYLETNIKGDRSLSSLKSKPGNGIIVGACYKKEGSIQFEGDEGHYFEPTSTIFFYRIREGLLNKECIALPEDIALIKPFKIPMLKTHQLEWTEEMRKTLREDMKSQPRDKKGRWLKL